MILKEKIFRAYDIRGEAFVDFDEYGFGHTAYVFGKHIQEKHKKERPRIFVSGDSRLSMERLFPHIIDGLKRSGCVVIWGGAITTPMNYFMLHEGQFDAIIQISASHNPPKDNGLKMNDRFGPICGEEIETLYKKIQAEPPTKNDKLLPADEQIPIETLLEAYIKKLKSVIPEQSPRTLVLDSGNAIPGTFYPKIVRMFGHTVEELYCDLDARFPNHQPDPDLPEAMEDLQDHVRKSSASLGFSFDGDGDRVGVVLHDGTRITAEKILYVLACDFLSRNPNADIVINVTCSNQLIEKLKRKGGNIHLSKTGHAYVHETMEHVGALFGGEQSGHFMFGENFYGHDDALLATLRFIQAIENNPQLEEEVTRLWKDMYEFEIKMEVDDDFKFQIFEDTKQELLKKYTDANIIDGIRINFSTTDWGIIRCSNTTPKIQIRVQAEHEDNKDRYKKELFECLLKHAQNHLPVSHKKLI